MSEVRDGQALHRLPVQNMSQSASCQPRLGNRLAHVGRDVRDRVRSAVDPVARRSVSGTLAAVTGAGPAVVPGRVTLVVVAGIALGVWAIAVRRIILGLILILLALAVAGAAALAQEGQHALVHSNAQIVTARSRSA